MREVKALTIFDLFKRLDFMPLCICLCAYDVHVCIYLCILKNNNALVLTEASGSYKKNSKTIIYNDSSIACHGCHQ